jgi:APA family basic amino acid/polyamine antiporter
MTEQRLEARQGAPELKRSLSFTLIMLYGLGTTIGAGIFVLVGKVAGTAGVHAPLSFLAASLLVAPTVLSFGELASRYPVSAGEAHYVQQGIGLKHLPLLVGLMVCAAGLVSASAIAQGFAGYLREFVAIPAPLGTLLLILILGLVAAWGIAESVTLAALFTLAEVGALLAVILAGSDTLISDFPRFASAFAVEPAAWSGILAGAVLAFYAFIGFEDMVNVAEEVKQVRRILPRAMIVTLLATTLLYVLVAGVAVTVAVPAELAASDAPLARVFEQATGWNAAPISLVALFAVVNGALIQIIMASRVLYGLSRLGLLPPLLGRVASRTRTPLVATALSTAVVILLAMTLPIVRLAEVTSFITVLIFALVNLALLRIKRRREVSVESFSVPAAVPLLGLLLNLGFAAFQALLWASR